MSKVVVSLPQGLVKNSIIGGLLSLAAYAALQFVGAALIDRGWLDFAHLYPMVCVSAALASFVGCGYSVLRGKGSGVLSVPAVVAVFLALTLAAALFTADVAAIRSGFTGIGLSMAAGGLLAALIGGQLSGRRKGRPRRRRRGQAKR